ncbi:MAG: anti-sigma factor [Geothrix sp.]|uniref:anti-sigma factor n=1 Tax=Geothrix sp. TaxID=1962974 RepID=UPI0017DEB418|nr:anti-sigma factor [Geothrix sp.]NWJ40347.1 anti-sigma factor [Geothrix sp.]WIL21647.1 MAG: anti-sigma factor [Geothrix sp.]
MSLHYSKLFPAALVVGVIAMAGAQSGCQKMAFWRAKPQEMHAASDVPAGQGTVRVTNGDNGNSKVSIRVKHLAPPSRIAPDSTVYVVWFRPVDGDSQNVGALVLNSDLEGSLDTLTPHHRFRITVTPEPNGQAASPTNEPVFTYNVESNK